MWGATYISYHIITTIFNAQKHPLQNRTNVQIKGGGVKGLLNNVKKNCTFLKGWLPLLSQHYHHHLIDMFNNSGGVADVPERHHQHRGRGRLRTLLLCSIPSTLPVTMIKHTMEEKCVLNYSSTVVLIKKP